MQESRVKQRPDRRAFYLIMSLWALWIVWGFGVQTLGAWLWLDVNGTITESRDVPSTSAPRYVTHYKLQGEPSTYTAGATDASLPRSLAVGTVIHKQRWCVDYELNGKTANTFPTSIYAMISAGAIWLAVWSFIEWRKCARPSKAAINL